MSQQALATPKNVCREFIRLVWNNVELIRNVYRGYEGDLKAKPNGYGLHGEVTIPRPARFNVRRGPTMSVQPVQEGEVSLKLDHQVGVDFQFSSFDQTTLLENFSKRVLQPAVQGIVSDLERNLFDNIYPEIASWVGSPSTDARVRKFDDYLAGVERLNEMAVPAKNRKGFLSPSDDAGLTAATAGMFNNGLSGDAYKTGKLGNPAGVETFMSQSLPTHHVGNHQTDAQTGAAVPLVNGTITPSNYFDVRNTMKQTIPTDGWKANGVEVLRRGDVITFAGVYALNPDGGRLLPFLKQFTVVETVSANGSGEANVTFSPAIIVDGPWKNCSTVPADGAAITVKGASNAYIRQNLIFDQHAIALAVVPMEKPAGAVDVFSETYKGISVRIVPVYNGNDDKSAWRMDMLYGFKVLNPDLATRLTGSVVTP